MAHTKTNSMLEELSVFIEDTILERILDEWPAFFGIWCLSICGFCISKVTGRFPVALLDIAIPLIPLAVFSGLCASFASHLLWRETFTTYARTLLTFGTKTSVWMLAQTSIFWLLALVDDAPSIADDMCECSILAILVYVESLFALGLQANRAYARLRIRTLVSVCGMVLTGIYALYLYTIL